jgi:hypothetical protein
MNDCTEARFLQDVAQHEMTVLRDDGLYRHIRFQKPGTGCMHFDLITWPGYLCYTGDMGTYVFSRLRDMFDFFRTDRRYALDHGRRLGINLSYWAEKVEAPDKHDGIKEFSQERFKREILEHLVGWLRAHRWETTRDERRELWEAVISGVIDAEGDSGGYRKQVAAYDFHHKVNAELGNFYFSDIGEYDFSQYSFRFVWCCYALAWGIQKYDESKVATAEACANAL